MSSLFHRRGRLLWSLWRNAGRGRNRSHRWNCLCRGRRFRFGYHLLWRRLDRGMMTVAGMLLLLFHGRFGDRHSISGVVSPDLLRHVIVNRAGMRFFLGHAESG